LRRYGIVLVFAAVFIAGLIFAVDLKPPTEQSSPFPEDHMFAKAKLWNRNKFGTSGSDQNAEIIMVWGVKVRCV